MIKHFGFDFPPVGIIGVLERTAPPDCKFYILDPISGVELPYHELDANSYVIITTNEGSSHRWFDRLIPTLNSYGVDNDRIIIRSCCLWDPDSPVRHIHTIVDECSDFVSTLTDHVVNTDSPTHHFVCLNCGHRWQRHRLLQSMLDRHVQDQGKITYLELPAGHDQRLSQFRGHDVSWQDQRNITDPEIKGALYNVITETAYEPEPETNIITHHHRPGMTEKSYKCFALYQIPIWLAPYRSVACYRNLGFDVFDDVVDHAYDLEIDPVKRIDMVADQVRSACQLPIADLVKLKQQLLPRFEQNLQMLKHHANNFSIEIPQWQVLFSSNNPI